MINGHLKPVFNAVYAAIFLYFARKTARKLSPCIIMRRTRYAVALPYLNYNVIAGSSNRLGDLVGLVNELAAYPKLLVEVIDTYRQHSVIYESPVATEGDIRTKLSPMHPSHVAASKVSIFDEFYGFCRISEHKQNALRSIARKYRQDPTTTNLSD